MPQRICRNLAKLSVVSCTVFSTVSSSSSFYVVRDGDTLSKIAKDKLGKPVYGSGGTLGIILTQNSAIKDPDKIRPGQRLVFEIEILSEPKAVSTVHARSSRRPAARLESPENLDPMDAVGVDSNASATPTPSSAGTCALVAAHETEILEAHDQLALDMTSQFTTLHLTDLETNAYGDLFTKYDVELKASWLMKWSRNFASKVGIGLRALDFEPSTNPTLQLSNTAQLEKKISVGAEHRIADHIGAGYEISYGEETFAHGVTSKTISVEPIAVPQASAHVTYRLSPVAERSIGTIVRAQYLGSGETSTYSVKSGFRAGGEVFYERVASLAPNTQFRVGLGYSYRSQDTSLTKLSESSILGSLSWQFDIFNGDKPK